MEQVDIIDEEDRVVGVATRADMRRLNLLHRVIACFVLDPASRLFVQERTATKDLFPSMLDVCVGGTVVTGEGYDETALRELDEEMGIRGAPVRALFTHRFEGPTRVRTRVYACIWDGPLVLQPEEVAGGDWHDEPAVDRLVAQGRVCPDTARAYELMKARFGSLTGLRRAVETMEPIRAGGG